MDFVGFIGARTDARGRFGVRLPAGEWLFMFSAPDGYDYSRGILPPGAKYPVLRTQNGRDADMGVIRVVVLRKMPRVLGRVLHPNGSPAGGATVFYLNREARRNRGILPYTPHTVARADGTFDLEMAGGGPVTLYARQGAKWRTPAGTTVLSGAPPPAPVRLRLQPFPATVLHGRVVDEAGRPVAGARLNLHEFLPEVKGGPGEPVADAAGNYHIEVLPGETYTVYAGRPGIDSWSAVPVRSAPVRAVPGRNAIPPLVLRRRKP